MKLPAWVAVLFIVVFLTTGKAGRGRTGPIERVRDEAHIVAVNSLTSPPLPPAMLS